MGQIHWHGKDAAKFLEKVVVGDISSLKPGEAKLSLIMKDNGGIVDDTVIANAGDEEIICIYNLYLINLMIYTLVIGDFIYMVVNGACKYKDMEHFKKYLSENSQLDVKMEYKGEQQLLALQGPGSASVLTKLAPSIDYKTMPFMTTKTATVAGISNCRVTRCGYTGEDGFEISVDPKNTIALADSLLKFTDVKPAGLGARDSLRLEAGLCLYGNDIDENTNPVEAGLIWTIGGPKSRRRLEQGFLGASTFLEKDGKLKKFPRKRIGIAEMKAPARGHTEIFSKDGTIKIGEITSGGFGPSLGKPVAMGYVNDDHSKEGTEVMLSVRGKLQPAKVINISYIYIFN